MARVKGKLHATYGGGEPDDDGFYVLLCGRYSENLRHVPEDDFDGNRDDACSRCAKAVVRRRVEYISDVMERDADPRVDAAFAMTGEEWEALAEHAERELWVWERMERGHTHECPEGDRARRMQKLWRESLRMYQTCAAVAEKEGEELDREREEAKAS